MSLLKGKFVDENNPLDGSKIKLENEQALKAKKANGTDKEILKVNAEDKIELLDLPVVSSDPTDPEQLARKQYVDAAVAAEEQLRIAGDQANGQLISQEQLAREAADQALDLRVGAIETDYVDSAELAAGVNEAKGYADQKVADLVGTAPEMLDTLQELAEAVQNDQSGIASLLTQVGQVESGLAQEILDRQAGDSQLDARIDALEAVPAEVVDSMAGNESNKAPSVRAAKEYIDAIDIAQSLYVDKSGSDVTGTGTAARPFATVMAAMNAITDASPTKRYSILVAPGFYTESAFALKANVFVIGQAQNAVQITATSFALHSGFTGALDHRSGFSSLRLNGACNFNWATVTSAAGKLYMNEVWFLSAVTMYGHNNAIAQALINSCTFSSTFTITGINVGVHMNNLHYGKITLNQHPSGGMESVLNAIGGTAGGGVELNTSVADNTRRCRLFAKSFWMGDSCVVNGPSSYADMTNDSVSRYQATATNGGNLVYISPVSPGGVQPDRTNERYIGDFGNQWLYNFGYIHGSTGTDLYVSTMPGTYDFSDPRDTAGRSVYIEADGYGLRQNVDGGNVQIATAETSGTGVRGYVKLSGRHVEVSAKQIKDMADATDAKDAVTKSQLDAASAALDSRLDTIESSYATDEELAAGVLEAKGYADQKVADLVGTAPEMLDTLQELAAAVQSDQSGIATLIGQVAAVESGLAQEILDRAAADTALQGEVDAVESGLAQELLDRAAADTALQGEIDALEIALAEETQARAAVDMGLGAGLGALDARVTELEGVKGLRSQKDTFILDQNAIDLGYIDLGYKAEPMSIDVVISGLVHAELDDYTASDMMGMTEFTRITFLPPLLAGGASPLEVGDKVHVKYLVAVPFEGGGGGGGELLTPDIGGGLIVMTNDTTATARISEATPGSLYAASSEVIVTRMYDNTDVVQGGVLQLFMGGPDYYIDIPRPDSSFPEAITLMKIKVMNSGGFDEVYVDVERQVAAPPALTIDSVVVDPGGETPTNVTISYTGTVQTFNIEYFIDGSWQTHLSGFNFASSPLVKQISRLESLTQARVQVFNDQTASNVVYFNVGPVITAPQINLAYADIVNAYRGALTIEFTGTRTGQVIERYDGVGGWVPVGFNNLRPLPGVIVFEIDRHSSESLFRVTLLNSGTSSNTVDFTLLPSAQQPPSLVSVETNYHDNLVDLTVYHSPGSMAATHYSIRAYSLGVSPGYELDYDNWVEIAQGSIGSNPFVHLDVPRPAQNQNYNVILMGSLGDIDTYSQDNYIYITAQ